MQLFCVAARSLQNIQNLKRKFKESQNIFKIRAFGLAVSILFVIIIFRSLETKLLLKGHTIPAHGVRPSVWVQKLNLRNYKK